MKTPAQQFSAILGNDSIDLSVCHGVKIADALQAWKDGKDFYSQFNGYVSIRNLQTLREMGFNHIRFVNLSRTIAICLEI